MNFDDIVFPDVELVLELHEQMLDEHGGSDGIRDKALLESALASPQTGFGGVLVHDTLCKMAAALAFALTKNHPFVDGNKRTAFLTATTFLKVNGLELPISSQWEELIEQVADGSVQRDELATSFVAALGDDIDVEP